MKIHILYNSDPPFGPDSHEMHGLGGTENFVINAAKYLARAGHRVVVYNRIHRSVVGRNGDKWRPVEAFVGKEDRDVLWSCRFKDVFLRPGLSNTRLKALYLADTESYDLGEYVRSGLIDLAMFVGQWQADKISAEEGLHEKNVMVTSNGIDMQAFEDQRYWWPREVGKCIHMSTPERGLEPLLDLWPRIQERVPDANLHLYSSFKGWGVSDKDNQSMSATLYDRIKKCQHDGMKITNHIHVNANLLRRALLTSVLFLYPTRWFNETNCMCALEAAAAGLASVVTGRAALLERVEDGVTGYVIKEGESHDDNFVESAVRLLEDPYLWRTMSDAAFNQAQSYNYKHLVTSWEQRWTYEIALRR